MPIFIFNDNMFMMQTVVLLVPMSVVVGTGNPWFQWMSWWACFRLAGHIELQSINSLGLVISALSTLTVLMAEQPLTARQDIPRTAASREVYRCLHALIREFDVHFAEHPGVDVIVAHRLGKVLRDVGCNDYRVNHCQRAGDIKLGRVVADFVGSTSVELQIGRVVKGQSTPSQ